ncbi:MAG: hypothetical protein AAF587_18575 [Bacteroidota bacterium]
MNRIALILLIVFSSWLSLSSCREDNPDLTTNIVGIYEGILTLNLDTDSIRDVNNQQIEIIREDDTHVRIVPLTYPDESPADSIQLTAFLSPTPQGFINTRGVMLTISQEIYDRGTIVGVPFSVNIQGDEHGKYERETGKLLYTLETVIDGVAHYELFEGQRQ